MEDGRNDRRQPERLEGQTVDCNLAPYPIIKKNQFFSRRQILLLFFFFFWQLWQECGEGTRKAGRQLRGYQNPAVTASSTKSHARKNGEWGQMWSTINRHNVVDRKDRTLEGSPESWQIFFFSSGRNRMDLGSISAVSQSLSKALHVSKIIYLHQWIAVTVHTNSTYMYIKMLNAYNIQTLSVICLSLNKSESSFPHPSSPPVSKKISWCKFLVTAPFCLGVELKGAPLVYCGHALLIVRLYYFFIFYIAPSHS